MRKRILGIMLSLCMVLALTPVVALAEGEGSAITISGPDKICSQQDYEFTVTPAAGVTLSDILFYNIDGTDYSDKLTIDDDGVGYGKVSASLYKSANEILLTVTEKTTEGSIPSVRKPVKISQDHIFVDGVCGCGEKNYYAITYEFDHGTLSGSNPEKISKDGGYITLPELQNCGAYKFLGWQIKDSDDIDVYSAGYKYYPSEDMTFVAVYEEPVTFTVPFTTTVEQGGNFAPGETTFNLKAMSSDGSSFNDVKVSGSVTTNGAGSYKGTMTITGPSYDVSLMLSDGIFVQQVNEGKSNWTYDDAVWGLKMVPVALASTDEFVPSDAFAIFPATYVDSGDSGYYEIIDGAYAVNQMTFKNIYTENAGSAVEDNKNATSTEGDQNAKNTIPQTGDNTFVLVGALILATAAGLIGMGASVRARRKRGLHAK